MKTKLVFLTTVPVTANTFLKGQLTWLRERGFDITVISSPGGDLDELAARERVAVVPLPMEREISPRRDLVSLVQLWRVLRELRPDIVNAGTPKAGLLGMIAARAAGVPVRIYSLHGLRLETTRGLKRLILATTERLASALARRVTCVSESLRQLYVQLGLAPARKTWVPAAGSANGLDVAQFALTPEKRARAEALRARLGLPADALVIGFVARFTRDKGVVELLEAFDRLAPRFPQARLLMLGDFEKGDPVPESCVRRIETHPAIVCAGYVPDPVSYYPLMHVLAFPSYREGFPNVPLEAAASGIPVVAFRATGAVDAVVDGVTGAIVPQGDVEAFTRMLERYLGDETLRRAHGEAGRERVAREFRPEAVWEALRAEYARLRHASRVRLPRGKRLFDFAVSAVLLIVLSPLLLLIALLVRRKLGSPALFRQERPGLHGEPFTMVKFRTLTDACDARGEPLPDEQRLTPFGQALRSSSLDELPELWNVLRGEMSLVGPRPLLMRYLPRYSPEQRRRHDARPGITGWAQVNGRNAQSWERKFALDVSYVDRQSFAFDLMILWKTVSRVLSRDGISAPDVFSSSEFMGSAPEAERQAEAEAAALAPARRPHSPPRESAVE